MLKAMKKRREVHRPDDQHEAGVFLYNVNGAVSRCLGVGVLSFELDFIENRRYELLDHNIMFRQWQRKLYAF